MKKWLVTMLLLAGTVCLGIPGCGYDPTGNVDVIQLAIYTPDCVDVLDASMATGAHLQIYRCGAGKLSQEWMVIPVNNGQDYLFENAHSQLCMSVASDPDTAPGQYVEQDPCVDDGSNLNEVWSLQQGTGGEAGMRIISMASGQCLDLPYGAAASIFTLQQYTCDADDPAQGWVINPVSKGNVP
jgi:hypothetical protein